MIRSPEHRWGPAWQPAVFCPVSWRTSGFQSVSRGLCAGGWRTRLWTTTFSSCKSVALCLWKAPHTALFESNNTRAIRTQHLNAFWPKRVLLNCTSKKLITPHTCNNNHPCSLGLDWDVYTTWEGVLKLKLPWLSGGIAYWTHHGGGFAHGRVYGREVRACRHMDCWLSIRTNNRCEICYTTTNTN